MSESHVNIIDNILCALKLVARQDCHRHDSMLGLELRPSGQRWCGQLAEVGEYQSELFLRGITFDSDLPAKGLRLCRLLNTTPISIELPTVKEATQLIAFDPATGKLGTTMGAAKADDLWSPTFTAVQGEILSHHANGDSNAGGQLG
jgi:hypothetical protein